MTHLVRGIYIRPRYDEHGMVGKDICPGTEVYLSGQFNQQQGWHLIHPWTIQHGPLKNSPRPGTRVVRRTLPVDNAVKWIKFT